MVARIAGGAVAGWLLSLAPLIVVNAISLNNGVVDPSSTALAGAVALALGIALGGLAAGLIGGRRGGVIAGAIAGALFAACLIGLMYALRAQGNLPNLVALHPVRTVGALVFIGALVAGVALLSVMLMRGRTLPVSEAARSGPAPRSQASGPRQPNPAWPGPRSGPVRGQSQPRPDSQALAPARRMDRGWTPDPRGAPPGSAPRRAPSQPARPPATATRDERGRWPDAPGRW